MKTFDVSTARAAASFMMWCLLAVFANPIACGGSPQPVPTKTAREAVATGAPLIDVRSPEEFADGHLDGAVNIPVGELDRRFDEVAALAGADKTVVVYCRSGRRSASAAKALRAEGFAVIDVGSITAW